MALNVGARARREGLTGREKESRFLDSELRRWNDGWWNARSVRSPN